MRKTLLKLFPRDEMNVFGELINIRDGLGGFKYFLAPQQNH
jgi:hypothetical protein